MADVSTIPAPSHDETQGSASLCILLSVVLLLALPAILATSHQNEQRALAQFRHAVDRYQADVQRQLLGYRALAQSMAAGLSAGAAGTSRSYFELLATALSSDRPLGPLGAVSLLEQVDARRLQPWLAGVRRQYPELEVVGPGAAYGQRSEGLLVRNRWPLSMVPGAIGRHEAVQQSGAGPGTGTDESGLPGMRRLVMEPAPDASVPSYVIMAAVGLAPGTGKWQRQPSGSISDTDVMPDHLWVALLLPAEALFRQVPAQEDSLLSVHVVDMDTADPRLQTAYRSAGHRGGTGVRLSESRRLSALGRTWHVTYETTPGFEAAHRDFASKVIGLTGLIIGIAAALAFLLRRARGGARGARLFDDPDDGPAPGPRTAVEAARAMLRMAGRGLGDRVELALRASESKNRMLAAVVQQTTAAVITKDLDNRITSWNRGAERLYGYPAGAAIGRLSHELLNPDITPEHLAGLLARIRGGSDDVNRLQHIRADGTRIDIESSHAPQFDDAGRRVGRITVIRDITEQLRAQRSIEAARAAAEQAQVTMSTFLANMSHELRTPMHAILSYARLAQDRISKGAPDKTTQYLDRIEHSGGRLLSLLNDLLDLSRLEAGRMPIDAGHHELAITIDTALLEVTALARARQLTLERTGLPALRAWYDPARIAQVLANMLGNAVKFSTEGGTITVSLAQTAADGDGAMAEITIADQGVGIPEREREAIFDKFTQSSTTRTGAGGTGLGLAISRELVLAHGGEIRARDNPGGGTRFIFTLPLRGLAAIGDHGAVQERIPAPGAVGSSRCTTPPLAGDGSTAQDRRGPAVDPS